MFFRHWGTARNPEASMPNLAQGQGLDKLKKGQVNRKEDGVVSF